MRKFLCTMISLMVFSSTFFNYSMQEEVYNDSPACYTEKRTDEGKVDDLIGELNRIAVEKAFADFVNNEEDITESRLKNGESNYIRFHYGDEKVKTIERQLEQMGVHKIDPNSSADIKLLTETTSERNTGKYDILGKQPAPDLAAIANLYSLYIYDGTRKYNGKTYDYRYIKVVDNKGYNGLTLNHRMNAVGKGKGQVAGSILTFNIKYLFSSLLVRTPVGLAADWTMQNIFNTISSSSNVSYNSNQNLYEISHSMVTSMTYYYLDNNGWKLIGTGAVCDVIRADSFQGNINGKPAIEQKKTPFTLKTNGLWYDYVDTYFKNMSQSANFCLINEIGSFAVKGYSSQSTIKPPYARLPGDLP